MSVKGYFEESGPEAVKKDEVARAEGDGEFYERVEDYDPVLRDHCRLVGVSARGDYFELSPDARTEVLLPR